MLKKKNRKVCRNRIVSSPYSNSYDVHSFSDKLFPHYTWSNRCFRTNWRKSDCKDKREKEKERVFGVVKLKRGTMWTFELLRANIILILFAESGKSEKFCPYFAVVRERAFPSSTDNDQNSWRKPSFVRALAQFSLLEKFRWLRNSVYSRIERLCGIIVDKIQYVKV